MVKPNLTKVALINPPYDNHKVLFFSLPYLVNGLRKQNLSADFRVFDCPAMQYTLEDLFLKLKEYQPDIIGISIPFTLSLKPALSIINMSKRMFSQAWFIAGGAHASLCPEDLFKECDYVVMGDGEQPMTKIVDSYRKQSKRKDVPGTVFAEKDKMIVVPRGEIDSDSMGSPDWSDVDLTPFLHPCIYGSQKKGFSVFTSKGCPYSCTYCSNHILCNRKVVNRDFQEVISEIRWLQKKYKINIFSMADEVFTLDRNRVFEFCDILEKEKLDIEWTFQTRADAVKDKEMFIRMRNVGARAVNIGIESGNSEVLRANKNLSLDQIINAVNILKSVNLLVYAGFIIGFPEDTIDTVWETITFPDKLDIDSPGFQHMVPYPKTKVREKAIKEGGILTNNFDKYSTYGVVYVPPGLNGYDLLAIRRFAFQYFHTRSRKRVDNFLKRFEGTKDYDSVKEKYNLIYDKKDKYDKEYLMSLKYSLDSRRNQGELERLPV